MTAEERARVVAAEWPLTTSGREDPRPHVDPALLAAHDRREAARAALAAERAGIPEGIADAFWHAADLKAGPATKSAAPFTSSRNNFEELERLGCPAPQASAAPEYDVPGSDLTTPAALAELERRRPHVDAVAAILHRMTWNRRVDPHYHSYLTFRYDARPGDKPAWRPAVDRVLTADDVRDMMLGLQVGPGVSRGIGTYHLDVDSRGDWILLDLDAKSEEQKKRLEQNLHAVERVLYRWRVPHLVARSRGGKGYHVYVFLAGRHPGRVLRAFGNLVIKAAGLKNDVKTGVELFPKQDELGKPGDVTSGYGKVAGNQTALPGDLTKWLSSGGSVLLDHAHEPLPFERWRERLEDLDGHRVTDEHLRTIGASEGTDLFAERPRPAVPQVAFTSDVRGMEPLTSLSALERFLSAVNVEVRAHRSPTASWTHRLILRACPNCDAHSNPADNRDAAILFDDRTGRVVFNCPHAGCAEFKWSHFIRKFGYEVDRREVVPKTTAPEAAYVHCPLEELSGGEGMRVLASQALPDDEPDFVTPAPTACSEGHCDHDHDALPPPPAAEPTSALDRILDELEPSVPVVEHPDLKRHLFAKHQRDHLCVMSENQFASGSVERIRGLRAACCGLAQKVRWCKFHGKVHACPLTCGRAGVCPFCSSVVALDRYEHVRQKWGPAGWVIFDAGVSVALSDPDLSYREVRRWFARIQLAVRRRKIRARRWFIGVHRVAFAFKDPEDAQYVADLLGRGDARLTAIEADPVESAHLVHSLTMEPARTLAKLLDTAEGMMAAANYPFLTLKHARRTGAGMKGEQLPWLSEEEFAAAGKERARERAIARGDDPDAFDHARCQRKKQGPDGRPVACGEVLENKVEVGGVSIASGRPGGAAWRVYDVAFAVMAAERLHARSTTCRTT